jgi:HEAT repeat protein/nicotinamidase-related amidase
MTAILIGVMICCDFAVGEVSLSLSLRSQAPAPQGGAHFVTKYEAVEWDATATAIVVVDMWEAHHCVSAGKRVAEMAPVMNGVLADARKRGIRIIHAPSDCMDFYDDTPQRKRAQEAPLVQASTPFNWNFYNPEHEGPLPGTLGDAGCACDTPEPCGPSFIAWKRQIASIDVGPEDAVSESGQQIFNMLEQEDIDNVIIMGVHTNVCVLGRSFGIRQMAYLGKNVVLCRDLTDPYHRAPGKHFQGLDDIVRHIETYWCPTIVSTAITGKSAFRFDEDTRPRIAFLIAEDEYEAATTLPAFARRLEQAHGFSVDILHGDETGISGIKQLASADLAVVYVRRKPLPAEQMSYLRDFVAAGKPVVGLRTASHAFHLLAGDPPAGFTQWPEFDQEVLGGNYHMHHGNQSDENPSTYLWKVPEAEGHPILRGIPAGEFSARSWLYKTSPLAKTATPLMMGRFGDVQPHEPVAWTNTHTGGGLVFYTSLGHPDDFKMYSFKRLLTNGIFWALKLPQPSLTTILSTDLDELKTYDFGDSRVALTAIDEAATQNDNETDRRDLAKALAAILESEASLAAKQFVCAQLRMIGDDAQVPQLTPLLRNEETTDIACFALRGIASPAASKALLDALDDVVGAPRNGIIAALGELKYPEAVVVLGGLLSESEYSASAAAALGRIGTNSAAEQLQSALTNPSEDRLQSLLRAALECVDALRVQGELDSAARLCEAVLVSCPSGHYRAGALEALVELGRRDGASVVLESLSGGDRAAHAMAVRLAQSLPGAVVTGKLAAGLSTLPAPGRVKLLRALGDRGDASAAEAVTASLVHEDESLRLAAIEALAYLGNGETAPLLVRIAARGSGSESEAAMTSLSRMTGHGTDEALTALLGRTADQDMKTREVVISVLAARATENAVPALVQYLREQEGQTRVDAWKALGTLGSADDLTAIIPLWLSVTNRTELKTAELAVVRIVRRTNATDSAMRTLLRATESAKGAKPRESLFSALGSLGDARAWPTLRQALHGEDRDLSHAVIQALEDWASKDVLDDLMGLARNALEQTTRSLALRTAVSIMNNLADDDAEVVESYVAALVIAEHARDRVLILSGLSKINKIPALKAVAPYLDDEEVLQEAAAAATRIALGLEKMAATDRDYVRQVLQKILDRAELKATHQPAGDALDRLKMDS